MQGIQTRFWLFTESKSELQDEVLSIRLRQIELAPWSRQYWQLSVKGSGTAAGVGVTVGGSGVFEGTSCSGVSVGIGVKVGVRVTVGVAVGHTRTGLQLPVDPGDSEPVHWPLT